MSKFINPRCPKCNSPFRKSARLLPTTPWDKPQKPSRYIYETRRVSKNVALEKLAEEKRCLISRILDLKEKLRELCIAPLQKTAGQYVKVFEGDPRYDKADLEFDPSKYTGEWRFSQVTEMFNPAPK